MHNSLQHINTFGNILPLNLGLLCPSASSWPPPAFCHHLGLSCPPSIIRCQPCVASTGIQVMDYVGSGVRGRDVDVDSPFIFLSCFFTLFYIFYILYFLPWKHVSCFHVSFLIYSCLFFLLLVCFAFLSPVFLLGPLW